LCPHVYENILLCEYLFIYMYAYVYVYIYIYTYISIYKWILISISINPCVFIHIYVHFHAFIYTSMHIYSHQPIDMYIYMYVRTYVLSFRYFCLLFVTKNISSLLYLYILFYFNWCYICPYPPWASSMMMMMFTYSNFKRGC
jgi:hypothetical protein